MRYVLDASVAVSWCFRESDARADAAIKLLHQGAETLAPLHWWFEVRNVAIRGIRQKWVSEREVTAFFQNLRATPVALADLPDEHSVFTLARRHNLTFYDAAYLELAQRETIALATLDQALARAAVAEGVALIGS